ncbi:MAG: hypothetical protein AB7L66_19070 [Gemmatimonadales bacterium]
MMWLATLALAAAVGSSDDPQARVEIDEGRKEVIVTAGPFDVAAMPPGMSHDDMEMMGDHNTPLIRFEWPIDGWLRGFRVDVVDAKGHPVDRRIIHHLIGVNFDRRQLLYPAIERIFGIGRETPDMEVPRSIGVPMTKGYRLGMYMAWQNETGADLEGIQIKVHLSYSPKNLNPRPVDALPLYMDVNLTIGGSNAFDVPPGKSEKAWEFTMPIDGRLLGYSGHMHDYGAGVRLEEAETGKVIARVEPELAPDGKITGISRSLPGVGGDGILLRAGRRYRVVGMYDNPTGKTLEKGAMAHISGIFAPSDYSKWPMVDLANEQTQDDLAALSEMGQGGHKHSGHSGHTGPGGR